MKNKITSNKNLKKTNVIIKNTKSKKDTSNKQKKIRYGTLIIIIPKDQELVSVIRTK